MPSFLVSFHPYSTLPFPSCGKYFPEPFVFNRGPSDQSINELLRIIGNYSKPHWSSCHNILVSQAHRTQGIAYFDSFNTFSSKQKLQKALKSWSNFGSVLFGKATRPLRKSFAREKLLYGKFWFFFQRWEGGVIFNPKIYVADYGT